MNAPRRRLGRARGRHLLQSAPFLTLVIAVVGIPVAMLVLYSFRNSSFLGVQPGYTLEHYREAVSDVANRRVIAKSIGVGIVVATIVTFLAFTIAFAVRFRFRQRTAVVALALVLLSGISSFLVRIYAWGTILGTGGLINKGLQLLHVIDHPLGFLFFGYFAIVVTMVYVYLPVATLLMYSAMAEIDPRTVEASRDLGAGRWRTAFRTVAPQARAGFVGAFVLTAIFAASDYVTPSLVGGIRGQMIGSVVRDTVLVSGDFPAAAALSIVYILALLVVIGAVLGAWVGSRRMRARLLGRLDGVMTSLASRSPARLARASLSRPAAAALIVYLMLPAIVVLIFSFNSAQGLGLPFRGVTLDWYSRIVKAQGFTDALQTSVKIAIIAVAASVLIAVPAGFAMRSSRGRALRLGVYVPYVVPGVMIGAALITTAADRSITLGVGPTILVHILLSAPLIVLVIHARLIGMDPKLVEAARDLGSSATRAFRTVTLPMILPSIIGAALLAVAYSLDEIIVTTFTIGTDNTVPIWLFGQARRGFDPGINALGMILSVGTLLFFAGAVLALRRGMSLRGGRI